MNQRLLAILAHPDDEAFGIGATLAHYANNGTRVGLICATNGDVGEIAAGVDATPETLWRVRQDELRCAVGSLGVHDLVFLNYRDSGMAGTEENADPRAYINAPDEEVVRRLVRIIREHRPQVVITFDPYGAYGHPDHIAVHKHTVMAFHAAGDSTQFPAEGQPWQARRLFYMAIPRGFWTRLRDELAAAGEDVSDWDSNDENDRGWPDDQVHVTMVMPDTVDAKLAALECHASQFGAENMFRKLSPQVTRDLLCQEFFALAWPQPEPGLQRDDLFAGMDVV